MVIAALKIHMKLEDYLEALKHCPDEQLTDELGISDNWPIFLKADIDSVVEYLRESGEYKPEKTVERADRVEHLLSYVSGTVLLQVFDWVPSSFTTGCGANDTERDRIESERQMRDYKTTILLHPYQDRKMSGIINSRAVAIVVEEIGQFVIQGGIPACMPNTIGWKSFQEEYPRSDQDYSRIVYHQPDREKPL